MNKFHIKFFLLSIVFIYSCRSLNYSTGGRVETKYRNYYFNDQMRVGAVLYGDIDVHFNGVAKGDALPKLPPSCKTVLKRYGVGKSDTILFYTIPKSYSIVGIIRLAKSINLNEYRNVLDGKNFYLSKRIRYKNRDTYEGLVRIDVNRYLSIIDYGESDNMHAKAGFHTIMINTAQRVKDGNMMSSVLNPFDDIEALFDEHGYLAPFKLSERRYLYKDKNLFDQALATFYSFCGSYNLTNQIEKSFIAFRKETIDVTKLSPAATTILNKTIDKKVVMFNCAHHRPEHTYFVGQLLDDLYKQGYTYLALEALGDSISVMEQGFVNFESGYYTRDPVLSNLIRKAILVGFKVIGYDTSSNNRELDQAKNIFAQTFQKDSNARTIVLAGYAHINEEYEAKKMAAYFKEITGTDPLTIDQTRLMTSSCQEGELIYRGQSHIYNKDLASGTDLLMWNNLNMQNLPVGFPKNGSAVETQIVVPDVFSSNERLASLLIYDYANYTKDTTVTPVYIQILSPNHENIKLKLEKGKYLFKVLGDNKRELYVKNLIIK